MNPVIATGHLMRCLSIAEAAVEMGEEITIISADEYPSSMVNEKGYHHIVLGTDWRDMKSELPAMKKYIDDNAVKVLLIDSYQVTEEYLRELNTVTKVFYIDDLNECICHVTGLINYACYADDMKYDTEGTEYYKGCMYAPLRKMFRDCKPRIATKKPDRLLVMSGGSDPCDMIGRTLDVIRDNLPDRYSEMTFICGRYYENPEELKRRAAKGGTDFEKRVNIISTVENMREYLEKADVVISAGGTTMYEVCAVGVPTISFLLADNQRYNVNWLNEHEIIPYAGDARTDAVEMNIVDILKRYDDIDTINGYSKRMQGLVDGLGAVRLATLLRGINE